MFPTPFLQDHVVVLIVTFLLLVCVGVWDKEKHAAALLSCTSWPATSSLRGLGIIRANLPTVVGRFIGLDTPNIVKARCSMGERLYSTILCNFVRLVCVQTLHKLY